MSYLAAGTLVGYVETPYNIDGNAGVSRKLSVSTGDAVEVISLSDEFIATLGLDAAKLQTFGRPVVCRVKIGAYGGDGRGPTLSAKLVDISFLARVSDLLPYGYAVDVFEDEPVEPSNGKKLASVEG